MLHEEKQLTANYLFVRCTKLQVTDMVLSHEFWN